MNPKRMVKKVKFARALIEGKSQTQAAIESGSPPAAAHNAGSKLVRDPEVKEIIAAAMKKHNLGPDAYCEEIRRGLNQTRADGKRIDFVDRLGSLNGIALKIEDQKPTNQILIINDMKESREKGII